MKCRRYRKEMQSKNSSFCKDCIDFLKKLGNF